MAFLDDVAKKVGDVANKGRDIADITKLRYQISEEEKKLNAAYAKIGKIFVEKYGHRAVGNFAVMIEDIQKIQCTIEEHKVRIRELKGIELCKKCGCELPIDGAFCPSCGERLGTDNLELDDEI